MQRTLPIIAVNGIVDAQVSPLDRGFTYGDGVFETCRMVNARIPLWHLHSERLRESCKKLAIPVQLEQINQQLSSLLDAVAMHELAHAVVKITVTRGVGGRGYKTPEPANPTIVIAIFPANNYQKDYYTHGVVVRVCEQRLSCNPSLAGLKHLNRLEQIIARSEWQDDSIAEGVMLDVKANVIEAVFSNIFIVKAGKLLTPNLSEAGVAGVMRRFILDTLVQALNIRSEVVNLSLDDVKSADEIFLCNSLYGIWPVKLLQADKEYSYKIGPVSILLQQNLTEMLNQLSASQK